MSSKRATRVRWLLPLWAAVFSLAPVAGAAPEEPPHLVIVMAEREYETDKTLPRYAKRHLADDFQITYVTAPESGPGRNDLEGIEALKRADVALFSVRRRAPTRSQMKVIRGYIEAGGPLVGIRTTSHAFSLRGEDPPEGHATWEKFDPEVIGGNYHGHYGGGPVVRVRAVAEVGDHPILEGVKTPFEAYGSLYQSAPLAEDAHALLEGEVPGNPAEPVAWTHRHIGGGRVFYTSLGAPKDFRRSASFRRLLRNGIDWVLKGRTKGR